jgi:hypothetical protein
VADDQEQKPKYKKAWHKKWRPRQFAKYLMSINMKYVLPGVSDEIVMEEVPDLHCGIGKVSYLRNHADFNDEVEKEFNEKIRSQRSTETMFWIYLKHCFEKNIELDKPALKLLDVLGILSGKYNPAHVKKETKKGKTLTPAQAARLLHEKSQIEAKLNEINNLKAEDEGKDGEDE